MLESFSSSKLNVDIVYILYLRRSQMLTDYDTWLSTLPEPKPEHDFDIDDREYENALEDEWERQDEI